MLDSDPTGSCSCQKLTCIVPLDVVDLAPSFQHLDLLAFAKIPDTNAGRAIHDGREPRTIL